MWKAIQNFFALIFGLRPCCENPKVEWSEGFGYSTTRCLNCGSSRVYGI